MKRLFLLLFAIVLSFTSSCEKDDLCTAGDIASPRMVVVFKDAAIPTLIKEVEQLRVRVLGATDFAPLDFEGSTLLETADTIYLPLRNFDDLTIYSFQRDNDDGFNSDSIDFGYDRDSVYVNRACGFKNDYLDLTADLNLETPDNPWIQDIIVVDQTINDSNEVHVEIYH